MPKLKPGLTAWCYSLAAGSSATLLAVIQASFDFVLRLARPDKMSHNQNWRVFFINVKRLAPNRARLGIAADIVFGSLFY